MAETPTGAADLGEGDRPAKGCVDGFVEWDGWLAR